MGAPIRTLTASLPLGTEIGDTIEHARTLVAAVPGGDHKHAAVARYALRRTALVLEGRLKEGEASCSSTATFPAAVAPSWRTN